MTLATAERLRNLRVGWRIRLTPEGGGEPIDGTVSEVNDRHFRLGIDPVDESEGDGTSRAVAYPRPGERFMYDLEILDTDGEIVPEVIEKLPTAAQPSEFNALGPENPIQSDPSGNAVIADPTGGYVETDELGVVMDDDGKAIRAGWLDDQAAADAEKDHVEFKERVIGTPGAAMGRHLCTFFLPLTVAETGQALLAIGQVWPSAYVDTSLEGGGPANEMRIRIREEG